MRAPCPLLHACILAAAAAGPTVGGRAARADDRPPPFEVGLAVGTHLFSAASGLGRYDEQSADNAPRLLSPLGEARLSRRFGERWAIEAEVGLVPTSTRDSDAAMWIWTGRLHAMRELAARRRWTPFVLGGLGFAASRSSDIAVVEDDLDGSLHAGVGARRPIGRDALLRIDGRLTWNPAVGLVNDPAFEDVPSPPEVEITVGVSFRFGTNPPPPPVDADGDGLSDAEDACLTEKGSRATHGCPDRDTDGDHVVDRIDGCPADGEDVDGFEDGDGCPDPDDDEDGIADAADKCRRQPESKNGYQDDDGCPDELPPAVKAFTGAIEGIRFGTDSADITSDSFATLDRAAEVLAAFPALRVEISGHTDTTGARDHNLALSGSRAEAVKRHLVGKGIAADRIRTVGHGPDRPAAANDTEAHRAKNRRIEFRLLRPGE